MKKIFIISLFFFGISYVFAIEDIEINNEYLIPRFDKSIHVYNYFTTSDNIKINVKNTSDEIIYGSGILGVKDGKNEIAVTSSDNEEYKINVFKNYKKNNDKGYLEELSIEGYDINFKRNIYEYYINIDDEEYLNINYKLSNYNVKFSISGNGNFNKSDNIVKIVVNDEEYKIHVLKSVNVSYVEEPTYKEMSTQKKELVILVIITISCILVFLFFYSIFIFN